MTKILHILTRDQDALAARIISLQAGQSSHDVKRVDLTLPAPDYRLLLEEIFAADSIEVW